MRPGNRGAQAAVSPGSHLRYPWLWGYGVGLVATHELRWYNSDDVAVQTMLSQWERGYHRVAHLGWDSFILKVPLYWVVDALMDKTRSAVLVTTLVLNAAGFTLLLVSMRRFPRMLAIRRPHSIILPAVGVAGVGLALASALILPT